MEVDNRVGGSVHGKMGEEIFVCIVTDANRIYVHFFLHIFTEQSRWELLLTPRNK